MAVLATVEKLEKFAQSITAVHENTGSILDSVSGVTSVSLECVFECVLMGWCIFQAEISKCMICKYIFSFLRFFAFSQGNSASELPKLSWKLIAYVQQLDLLKKDLQEYLGALLPLVGIQSQLQCELDKLTQLKLELQQQQVIFKHGVK